MKNIFKHKNKIIITALVIILLAFVYWWGGNSPSLRGWSAEGEKKSNMTAEEKIEMAEKLAKSEKASADNEKNQSQQKQDDVKAVSKTESKEEPKSQGTEPNKSGDDTTDNTLTCTLSVRCDTILQNTSWLKGGKADIVPKNGVIFGEKEVVFYEGESVFNVTLREMKKNRIHFEYMTTPIYNSAYIEGIGNLYEFDCGELSGWMYKVNGQFPSCGSSRHTLSDGDKIEWIYTCDLGYDIGGNGRWQKDE